MIQPNELRIGNIVTDKDHGYPYEISASGILYAARKQLIPGLFKHKVMQITDRMREIAVTTIFSMADIVNAKKRYYITDWAIQMYADRAAAIGANISWMASTIEKPAYQVDIEWMIALFEDNTAKTYDLFEPVRRKRLKRWKCSLIGHKVTGDDCGYPVCDRCGAHEYHDDKTFYITLPTILYWLKESLSKFRIIKRCRDCRKPEKILWWNTRHNHDECIPF